MPTLNQRIKAFLNPQSEIGNISLDKVHQDAQPTGEIDKAKKSADTIKSNTWLGNLFGFAGTDYPSGILQDNKFGYAQAYLSVMAVRQAVDYYAMAVLDIPSQVVKNTGNADTDDDPIARSDDVHTDFPLYQVFKYHRKTYGLSPLQAMIYNAVLYDEVYCEKVKAPIRAGSNHFRVLNSLGMDFIDYNGQITQYLYSWDGYTKHLPPEMIAYEHGFNPMLDLHGASILQSAISKIRIENNLDMFLQAFFKNNASLGLVGSPASNGDPTGLGLDKEQIATLKKIIEDWHLSARNSFRPLITNVPINWEVLPLPDIEKFKMVGQDIEQQILTAFGVNPALVGYTDGTSYKEDIPQIEAQFINKRLRPVLSFIQGMINSELLPFITKSNDYRFEFDYSNYQLVTEQDTIALDIRTQKLQSGTMSLNDYRKENGDEPIPEFEDMFVWNGVPVPKSEILNLWRYQFGQSASMETNEDEPLDDTPPDNDEPMESDDEIDEPIEDDSEDTTQKAHTCDTHNHKHSIGNISLDKVHPDAMPTYDDYRKAHDIQPINLDDIFNELVAWKKYIKAGKHLKSAFEPIHTRGDIADSIPSDGKIDGIVQYISQQIDSISSLQKSIRYSYEGVNEYRAELLQKSIQSTRLDFEIQVEDLIFGARNNGIDKRQFKTRLMQAIRGYGRLAFLDGLRVGGVITELTELDDNDSATIESHLVSQREYVNNLADTIYGKGISDAEAQSKPTMWFNKSISPLFEAGKASAMANAMMEWVQGATEQGCKDCTQLNGQRHRMKTYYAKGVLPQSDRLECNGFNCECDLVQVFASARGRLPSI